MPPSPSSWCSYKDAYMAGDGGGAGPITDVNYRVSSATPLFPSSAGLSSENLSSENRSLAEVWAVDPEELRRGSAAGLGPRHAGFLPGVLRWQWVATPPFNSAEVGAALAAAGSGAPRVVRLCPGYDGHRFPLARWLLAPLPELCDAANVAVLLDYGPKQPLPWDEVVELARRHHSLSLVVLGRGTGERGVVRSCLDAVPNVIFEISALGDPGWLSQAVAEVGAHRFVFGSGGDPCGVLKYLEAAALSPEDMRMVVSGVAGSLDSGSWAETWL
jgi:hypothetical protein